MKNKTSINEKRLIIENIRDFNLDHILDCGQCFRWERQEDGSYVGIAFGRVVCADYDADERILYIENATEEDRELWYDYFDLERNYGEIKEALTGKDKTISDAIEYGYGIRILNQENWETLLSFIISQNNNIPRIKKCINSLAKELGESAGSYRGREYYSLPSPERLAAASLEELAPCRLGYRASYLIKTANQFIEEGTDCLDRLCSSDVTRSEALEALCRFNGVGPKVANCIALFSLKKFDSFPIDVWVKKVMNQLYGIEEDNTKKMKSFAEENFGEYGGIAQQYLFYYVTHKKFD